MICFQKLVRLIDATRDQNSGSKVVKGQYNNDKIVVAAECQIYYLILYYCIINK